MPTRFFNQDASESLQVDELIEAINEIGEFGLPVRAVEWNTKSDFYSVAITTDLELTPERAELLYFEWLVRRHSQDLKGAETGEGGRRHCLGHRL